MDNSIEFTRVKNDVNNNPRYVTHFLSLDIHGIDSGLSISDRYAHAVKLANSIGGRKYHNKSYGGGLVFKSYNLDRLIVNINRVTGKAYTSHTITR